MSFDEIKVPANPKAVTRDDHPESDTEHGASQQDSQDKTEFGVNNVKVSIH